MFKRAEPVVLTAEDRGVLEGWLRSSTTEQRLALRGRIVIAAAEGRSGGAIARAESIRPATVSRWCRRFVQRGVKGLFDATMPKANARIRPRIWLFPGRNPERPITQITVWRVCDQARAAAHL